MYLGNKRFRLQLTRLVLLERISKTDNSFLLPILKCTLLFKYRYLGSLPTDSFLTLSNDTLATINMQPSQYVVWVLHNYCNLLSQTVFCRLLGLELNIFPNQRYKQMLPKPLPSHQSVCSSFSIYSALHVFKFRQEEIVEVYDGTVLPFRSSYMQNSHLFDKFVQFIQSFWRNWNILINISTFYIKNFTYHCVKTVTAAF